MALCVDQRNFNKFLDACDSWDEDQKRKVIITDKGQPKLYVPSKAVVGSLYKGSRKACKVWDLDEEDRKALLEAEVSPEHDHLNALLKED